MKRLLYALLGLTLLSGPAHAVLNLQPEPDGTTSILPAGPGAQDPIREFSACLGGVWMGTAFDGASAFVASSIITNALISPISNAVIRGAAIAWSQAPPGPASSNWRVTLYAGSQASFPVAYVSSPRASTSEVSIPAVLRLDYAGGGSAGAPREPVRYLSSIQQTKAAYSPSTTSVVQLASHTLMRGNRILVQEQFSAIQAYLTRTVMVYLCPR